MRRELVQVSLPSSTGATKACFVDVKNGTVGDLIRTLLEEDGKEIALDLACNSGVEIGDGTLRSEEWGLQKVILSTPNRHWSDEELLALPEQTDILDHATLLSSILPGRQDAEPQQHLAPSRPSLPARNFSDFALTAHLQVPIIRLVYLPFCITIVFTHVPEIPEHFKLKWYIGASMSAAEIIEAIIDELGIRKVVTQGSKTAKVEYTLTAGATVLVSQQGVIPYLQQTPESSYILSLSISEAWYGRIGTVAKSFSRALQRPSLASGTVRARRAENEDNDSGTVTSTTPSGWRPASIFGSLWQSPSADLDTFPGRSHKRVSELGEEETESDPTLKGIASAVDDSGRGQGAAPSRNAATTRGNNRLSSLFDVWSAPPAQKDSLYGQTASNPRPRIVSEPMAVNDFRQSVIVQKDAKLDLETQSTAVATETIDSNLETDFEKLMDQLGMKEGQRAAMRNLDDQRKQFLVTQQRQKASAGARVVKQHHTGPETSFSKTVESGSPIVTLSNLKRFSLWSNASSSPPQLDHTPASPIASETASVLSFASQDDEPATHPLPLLQTATGWSSWFSAGSPAKSNAASGTRARDTSAKDTPAFYISGINAGKISRRDLVKHLIALRVRLATAPVSWLQEFLEEGGLHSLEKALRSCTAPLLGRDGKDQVDEADEGILIETMRSLRTILNSEIGFERVLEQKDLVSQVTRCLACHHYKLRTLVADVMAAICVLSASDGHKKVLDAFSDYQVVAKEQSRFQSLLHSISLSTDADGEQVDEDEDTGLWEYRAAALALINALISTPEKVEHRRALRDEFARRGLNEIIATFGYMATPDPLAKQLAVFLEEKQEDLVEWRDKHEDEARSCGTLGRSVEAVVALCPELTAYLSELIESITMVTKNQDHRRSDLIELQTMFLRNMATTTGITESWTSLILRFLGEADPIIGRFTLISSNKIGQSSDVPSSFLDELLALRNKVETLVQERDSLASQLDSREALGKTLKSIDNLPSRSALEEDRPADQGASGVVQRLIAKEKEVLQLQKQLNALQSSRARGEDADEARKDRAERNRQWANLMDEIAKNKAQIAHLSENLEARMKEIKYLKRALESVYTRFQAQDAVKQVHPDVKNTTDTPAVDASIMASRTIEALAHRDLQISELKAEVMALREASRSAGGHASDVDKGVILTTKQADMQASKISADQRSSRTSPLAPPPPPPPLAPPPPPSFQIIKQLPESTIGLNESGLTPLRPPALTRLAGFSADLKVTRPAPRPPSEQVPRPVHTENPGEGSSSGLTPVIPQSVPPPPPPPPPPQSHGPLNTSHSKGLAQVPVTHAVPGAPPPPPHFGFAAIPLVSKSSALAPRVKLKPFFWNKLPPANAQRTIWSKIPDDNTIDLSELVSAFAADVKIVPKVTISATSTKAASLLPLQRAQNIAIMLARLRLSHSAIREALLHIDDRKLTMDRLKPLKAFAPTADERTAFADFVGDATQLSQSDQFMRTMTSIPRLEQRLACLITRRRFEMDLEELRPELAILRNAVDEIQASLAFKHVLGIVRAIGNTLNASTYRGNAHGFQLEALMKLRDTRATQPTTPASTSTLLHYVVRALVKRDRSLLNFLSESPHVHAASRISPVPLFTSIANLNKAIDFAAQEVSTLRAIGIYEPEDKFVPVMQAFVEESRPAMEALNTMSHQLEVDITAMLQYFGEDPLNTKPEEFLGLISNFSSALQRADEEIRDAEKMAAKGARKSHPIKDGKRSIGRGQFDEAMRDLRAGANSRRARQEGSVYRPRSRIMLDGSHR